MSGNPLPSSFDGNSDFYEENNWQKLSRRLKEEPLIPFGTYPHAHPRPPIPNTTNFPLLPTPHFISMQHHQLTPPGCALTVAALIGASRSIRSGDHNKTNRMFRARIMAQAFTLVAMVAGSIYWDADRKKRKEFEGAVSERKAKEKNEAWIRELEARDQEEKELKALREKRARRAAGERVAKVEEVVEKGEEGKGIMGRVGGIFGGGKGEPKPPTASSMVEDSERRRKGVLEMVRELANSRK
ncbi:hypothetical protein HYFRA_00004032 [Hymenoscyphus fraxineus]|uniref:HIG1 domain-containing protein n=1 Tax=Hymenoscyphus fraxineus TaxID=746836 RepID=A0A9N9PEY7_9HELO|nr:hypothetical protein HYFRA_00004032 [Hymenoscyphus fraxineus]